MDATFYKKTHTLNRVKQVCELAGIKYSWFDLCARGHGVFKLSVAIDLEAASRVLAETPDDYMTFDELFDLTNRIKQRTEEIRLQLLSESAA